MNARSLPLAAPQPKFGEWMALALLAVSLTLPFWLSDLDLRAAAIFYHPENAETPWPDASQGIWAFFYRAAPVIAIVFLLGSLAILARWGQRADGRRVRRMALFVLFSIILGPGLVINVGFKDHLGRPRPRQVEEFQGHLAYQPPGQPGSEGKSFPCGHCSVGYMVFTFYFLARPAMPILAQGILFLSIGLGLLMGVGRMAAGGHFLSDVLWSGLLSYAVCKIIYHPLVGKWADRPDHEVPEFFLVDHWKALPEPARQWSLPGLTVLFVAGGSLAMPYKTEQRIEIPLPAAEAHGPLRIHSAAGDVVLRRTAEDSASIGAELSIKGFGVPTSRIAGTYDAERNVLAVTKTGLFTDIEGRVELRVPRQYRGGISVEAEQGNIFLSPEKPDNWQLRAAKRIVVEAAAAKNLPGAP